MLRSLTAAQLFAAAALAVAGPAFARAAEAPATRPGSASVAATSPAADPWREHRIPLRDGLLSVTALSDALGMSDAAGVAAGPSAATAQAPSPARLDLTGDRGPTFVRHLRATLGPGCEASLDATVGVLTLRIDRRTLWADDVARRRIGRLLATGRADRPAAVDAAGYGLTLPAKMDPARPLVLLVHGLASDNGIWGSMADQLAADGHQVAFFRYSDTDPIAAAGDLLADCVADLRLRRPETAVRLLAHSMGGLVSRHFVEGPAYHGGVDRLVMLGTPNHGSACANWRWALELYQHYAEGKPDPNWSLRQVAKDCNGAAGRDLQPGSEFITALNARPRRAGVQYTVVAGNRNAFRNHTAGWIDGTGEVFPDRTVNWVGVRHVRWALSERSKSMRAVDSSSDGVVPLESARLEGVADFVVVHADHVALACGHPPAAWDVVRARLK
jgi:hypothetical protein